MPTRVVNVKNEKCDVRIHRKRNGSIPEPPEECCLGNPFHLHDVNNDEERQKVIRQYRDYFYLRLNEPNFKSYVLSLKGKSLGCFCAPKPCHGDIIKEFLDERCTRDN